jgi:hypothetical protein
MCVGRISVSGLPATKARRTCRQLAGALTAGTQKLSFERSLDHLKQAAIEQRCTTKGALAVASGVEWSRLGIR